MARPAPGAVPRRPQHISAIAHLFLQENCEHDAREPAAAICDIAVASPGTSPVSAFAAAGLALGSGQAVVLSEDVEPRWSAGTFLAGADPDCRVGSGARGKSGGNGASRNSWDIPGLSAAAEPTRSVCEDHAGVSRHFQWSHLGCLGSGELGHLEALAVAGTLAGVPLNGSGGLVWCLLRKEAECLAPSYMLGRLVEMIRPRRLRILVFPDSWDKAGRPGWLEEICHGDQSVADPGILTRGAELNSRACGGIPVVMDPVGGSDNLAASFSRGVARDSFWARVAADMMRVI